MNFSTEFYLALIVTSLVSGYLYSSMEFDMETRYAIFFSAALGLCAFLITYGALFVLFRMFT